MASILGFQNGEKSHKNQDKLNLETPPTHKSRPRLPNDPQSSLKCTPGELQNAQKRAPKAPNGLQIDRFYSRSQSKSVWKSRKIDVTVLPEFLLRLTWFCFRVGSQLEQFWMPTAKSNQTLHGNGAQIVPNGCLTRSGLFKIKIRGG